ncbi:MAG: TetR family transcriptional regulator C-terminal domain-containing protein [Gemmatimonadaceae bacterium]
MPLWDRAELHTPCWHPDLAQPRRQGHPPAHHDPGTSPRFAASRRPSRAPGRTSSSRSSRPRPASRGSALAGEAAEAGELPPATEAALFAFQLHGVLLSYHQAHHLMRDPRARARAEAALEMLLGAHRALAG